jgi:thiamine biosynthesis lipoprotein
LTSVEAPGVHHRRALGTTVTLAVDHPDRIARAEAILVGELDAIDLACSRFRPDSEIWALYASGGESVGVSALLFEAIATACGVAERTGGAVDPTVGAAVEALGYDRDFARVRSDATPLRSTPHPAPGWWRVELDPSRRSVRIPPGVRLDLGASAKALASDRAAQSIASVTECGVLVSIGGDVSVAGSSPADGWSVGIAVDSSTPIGGVGHLVSLRSGGLASSSTAVRSWRRGNRRVHHIVDPFTGDVASEYWKLVSVAADSCVDANAASTAAVVWGERAVSQLETLELPARLVRHDGTVVVVGGWPTDVDALSNSR